MEKILGLIAVLSIILAGVLGYLRVTGDIENEIVSLIPEGYKAQPLEESRFLVKSEDSTFPSAYVIVESAEGYGGEMDVAVLVDKTGHVKKLQILRHNETPSFLQKVVRKGLIKDLEGVPFASGFDPAVGVDVVSGATTTSEAIIECAKLGSRQIASQELGKAVLVEPPSAFSVGIPEIVLILLYVIALLGVYTQFRHKKVLRWFTLVTGLVVLGFWFSVPLTLSRINLFLLGYWPDWHDKIYWYILVFGFFIVLMLTRKNLYCSWICPLGCMQDGLGMIGGAKHRFPPRVNAAARWIQRAVAWVAILLALYFRSPVQVNYEIFGVSLSLTGATYLFVMTGIFFMASLFIKRPWCNYLCPITPVSDLVRLLVPKIMPGSTYGESEFVGNS